MDSYPRNHFYIIFAMFLEVKMILFYCYYIVFYCCSIVFLSIFYV